MSVNVNSTAYRRIDVDAYAAEKFDDTDETPASANVGPDEHEVSARLNSGQHLEALRAALARPPLKVKSQEVKDAATRCVVHVLTTIKQADVEKFVQALTDDELDTLMKYVYKGMELLSEPQTCQSLLGWHAQTVSRGGLGCIMRVMSSMEKL